MKEGQRDWKGSRDEGNCKSWEEMNRALCRVLACQRPDFKKPQALCSMFRIISFLLKNRESCLCTVLWEISHLFRWQALESAGHENPCFPLSHLCPLFNFPPALQIQVQLTLYVKKGTTGRLQAAVQSCAGYGTALNAAFGKTSKVFSPRTALTILDFCLEMQSTKAATIHYSIVIMEKPDYTGNGSWST